MRADDGEGVGVGEEVSGGVVLFVGDVEGDGEVVVVELMEPADGVFTYGFGLAKFG